jgi:hypothetical protein
MTAAHDEPIRHEHAETGYRNKAVGTNQVAYPVPAARPVLSLLPAA